MGFFALPNWKRKNRGTQRQTNTRLTQRDVATFNAQYPQLEVRRTTAFHDRFFIPDGMQGYFIGASLKDAGKKSFAILTH